MTDTTVIYLDAFILLFILLLIWIFYSFNYPILAKLSDDNIKKYLNLFTWLKLTSKQTRDYSTRAHYATSSENTDWLARSNVGDDLAHSEASSPITENYHSLLMLMRRIGFALVMIFCLPVETVHMFQSNAQYYWVVLIVAIAVYQCIKLLVFEQLELFGKNRVTNKLMQYRHKSLPHEAQILTIVIGWALFWVVVIYLW